MLCRTVGVLGRGPTPKTSHGNKGDVGPVVVCLVVFFACYKVWETGIAMG